MQRALSMRAAHQAGDGDHQQQATEDVEGDHQDDLGLGRQLRGHLHQLRDLGGQGVGALLEPQDGEDNVREVGHLLDVDHLADGQVDLDTSTGTQRSSHDLEGERERKVS